MDFKTTSDSLQTIHDYTFNEPYEICGNFHKSKQNLYEINPSSIMQGSISQTGRGMCYHQHKSMILFHTHPKTSYAFPSKEDVFKVLKSSTIQYSLIGTTIGLWVLYCDKAHSIDTIKNDANIIKNIKRLAASIDTNPKNNPEKTLAHAIKFLKDELDLKVTLYQWDKIL